MTSTSNLSAKERAALSRLRQILGESGLIRASWVKLRHPCGRESCRCARSKRNWHVSWYLSQSRKGKLRRKSVPKERLDEVRYWVERYWEARKLLNDVSEQYWDRLGKPRKRKRKR